MKYLCKKTMLKVLLLMLVSCPVLFTQERSLHLSFIKYPYMDTIYSKTGIIVPDVAPRDGSLGVYTDVVLFIVKEDYYNDELIEKFKNPPYSSIYSYNEYYSKYPIYSYNTLDHRDKYKFIFLNIKGNLNDINVLDHYLKFRNEEYVEEVIPYPYLSPWLTMLQESSVIGKISRNGKPLSNHTINGIVEVLNFGGYPPSVFQFNCITDESGNYIIKNNGLYDLYGYRDKIWTLSFSIGDTKYDTTFYYYGPKYEIREPLNMFVDINTISAWEEFDIKGQVLQNSKPVMSCNVSLTDQFNFVCNSITDENGNYSFPYMRADYNYTLSYQLGNTVYDTTFILGDDKILNFNIYAPTFDIKGKILHNGIPLNNHTIYLNNKFNLYIDTTDENGNYNFSDMIQKYDYTLFFKIEDNRYDTTFVLDEQKFIDINVNTPNTINTNEPKEIPTTYSLSQNYPNPFNPTTNFSYSVPNKTDVRIVVYDLFGREIKTLVNENKEAGIYNITWNGRDNNNRQVSTGVYFYKMQASDFQKTMKMLLMK